MSFANRIAPYVKRVERALQNALPESAAPAAPLQAAMRYAVLGGGKRIRPLLVYAAGETLQVPAELLDPPAAAIELMHAFSLIHDDLPAMDDDDVRRGRPSTHRAFDEATAVLAADALQPLAFSLLVTAASLQPHPQAQIRLVALLAESCGPNGMAGGQAIDLAAEGRQLDAAELEHMYRLKTGRLLRASVLAAACCPPGASMRQWHQLERFADALGIAYQIRDDLLDVENPPQPGNHPRSDSRKRKATYPALFGIGRARERTAELHQTALAALAEFGGEAEGLREIARYTVQRDQ